MSELEKTAPNEIYLIVGDTDKDCNFNELSEVTWADKPIYEETAIKYVKASQLTIPKSVADELDENYNNNHSLAWFDSPLSQNILNWYDENNNNWNIANIYINSKALGVDLVKVV